MHWEIVKEKHWGLQTGLYLVKLMLTGSGKGRLMVIQREKLTERLKLKVTGWVMH